MNLGSFGLKIIRSTVRNPIVVHVDKGMSFGKREWITLKGEVVNSTQEQLIYENDIKGYRLITTWIYQEISIGNNLLMLKPPEKDIAPNVFDSILSYNNILIHVQILPTGKKNTKPEDIAIENGKIIIELNNYLKKYKI